MLAGLYVIPHPELSLEDHAAFIKQGSHDYSMTGNLLLMMDVQQAIQWADHNVHNVHRRVTIKPSI